MRTNVMVVGAGPAGSTAAKFLSEKGIKVIIVDKERFPRFKPCGGGLPLRVLNRFPYIKNLNVIESYSYGGYIKPPSLKYNVKIEKKDPIIAMIRREKFDNELVKHAIDCGAEFLDGISVKNIIINKNNTELILDNGNKIITDLLIGADGCLSNVAFKVGLIKKHKNIGICIVEEFPVKSSIIEKYFTEKRLCQLHSKYQYIFGYGWVFPKKEHINIGIVDYRLAYDNCPIKKNLRYVFEEYLLYLNKKKIIPDEIKSKNAHGGILPVKPLIKNHTDHVLICGDASGFINPVSGEGIYYALASGKNAAEIAIDAIENDDTSEKFLSKYEEQWKNDFGRDLKIWLKSKGRWGKHSEKMIKLMKIDKKFAELLYLLITGQESIFEKREKFLYRYLIASMKYLFKKNSL